MKLKKLDIVYCLKEGSDGKELKYSMRSLQNIPHNKVWLYGGCPDWVDREKVNWVPIPQDKGNKWLNTEELLKNIVENDNITEDFIWFNDDFYVLKPINVLEYRYDRLLGSRINDFMKISWFTINNGYCTRLKIAARSLRWKGYDTKNFELHIPIIFNRRKFLQILDTFPNIGAKRSLYGNCFIDDAIESEDVKIYNLDETPNDDWDFLSTSDKSFREGEVGKWIKKKFNRKCEYEK